MKVRLIMNLQDLRHKDFFSGSSSATQLFTRIITTVNRHTCGSVPDVRTTNSTELLDYRREHIARFERGRPEHLYSDIFKRLPESAKEEMVKKLPDPKSTVLARRMANQEVACFLDDLYAQRGGALSCAPCDFHEGCFCDCDDSRGDGEALSLRGVTGGVPCVDSSAMNNFASGDGGRTYAACVCFCAERGLLKEDFVWVECTERWSAGTLRDRFPPDD